MLRSGMEDRVTGREGRFQARAHLNDNSTAEDLEDEIEWIQATLVDILNENMKVITICARSKRWWNDDIKAKRQNLGRATRRRRGEGGQEEEKGAKKALKRAIKKARRECWEDFLNRAEGEDVWAITRYTKP